MKKQRKSFHKTIGILMIVPTFVIFFSCQGQDNKTNQEIKKTAVSETKPPTLDIHAATFMGNLEAVNQHIMAGSDLNEKDQFGSSPLTIAATFDKTAIAIALINAGADLNVRSADGSTPLHTASFFCRKQIVKALLEKGADKTLRNKYGATPLETVSSPFADVKGIYDQLSRDLGSLGFKLDYKYLEATRPEIAKLLQ